MASASQIQEPLVPPINFAMACPGVYRSGYPTKKNYPFLRALRLRSILYLCPEDYAESNLKFCEENAITVLRFPTEGNKEPFTDISERLMHRIMSALVDVRHLPLLIHCNKGKHRTGTVVAALRLLHGWSLVSIFEEYKRFAGDKARVSDQTYVELYYPVVRITPPYVASWLTVTPRVRVVYSEKELLEEENAQLGYSLLAPVNAHADAVHVATVAAAIAAKAGSTSAAPAARHREQATPTPSVAAMGSSADLTMPLSAPTAAAAAAPAAGSPSSTPPAGPRPAPAQPVSPGPLGARSAAAHPTPTALPDMPARPTSTVVAATAEAGVARADGPAASKVASAEPQAETAAVVGEAVDDAEKASKTGAASVTGAAGAIPTAGAPPRPTNIRPSTKKAKK